MTQMDRRRILKLLGLSGASLYASSLGRPSRLRAAGAAVPKRVVFFFTEQGTLRQIAPTGVVKHFGAPTVSGAPDALKIQTPWSTNTFTLSELHQPLVPYQNKLLLIDGLDMLSAGADPMVATNAHVNGVTHALVANNRQTSSLAGGISIDQFIAKGLNSPSPVTALPSLEVFVNSGGHEIVGPSLPLYAASGQPLPIANDPSAIYKRILPNGPQNTASADQAKLAAQIAQQKSVLEFASTDFSNLAAKASKLDAARLNAHAAAIRDLESRLSLGANVTCTQPTKSIYDGFDRTDNATAFKTDSDILFRLVQMALACDITRVATFYISQAPGDAYGYTSGMLGTADFHDLVHKTNGAAAQGKTVPPLGDNAQAMTTVKNYHAFNSNLFAKFLGLLQAIPESDGSTLLDNTVVVWCGEIAGGDHSLNFIPYILAGGLGGSVKTGRYVMIPRTPNTSSAIPMSSRGLPHNNLLLSLANLMGVQATTFGNPSVCTGPLVQVLS